MVAHPREYPWSSYGRNANGETGLNADWLATHLEYQRPARNTADRQASCRQLFRVAIPKAELKQIRECTHKGWALGGERFREQIEALSQRRAASMGVGRPRKKAGCGG